MKTAIRKTKTTMPLPSEYQECLTLVEHLEALKNQGKITAFTHVSNETYVKSPMVRRMHTLQGLRKGFPDYIILTPVDMLVIEMKRADGGVLSDEQAEWINAFNDIGIKARVCRGYDEAKLFLDEEGLL